MAYSFSTLNNTIDLKDIITGMLSCAKSAGWTVNTTNNTIQYNSSSSVYTITSGYITSTYPYIQITNSLNTNTSQTNYIRSYIPVTTYNNGTKAVSNSYYMFMSKGIHCIYGLENSQPYLVMVLEMENSNFAHFYFGSITNTPLTGLSECYSSASQSGLNGTSNVTLYTTYQTYLFSAQANNLSNGGINVINSNNPLTFRSFISTYSTIYGAIGGYLDGFNNYKTTTGITNYSSDTILNPIPLLINSLIPTVTSTSTSPFSTNYTRRWMAVGQPAGVRHVNMYFLDATSQISDGTNTWIVFPAISKTTTPNKSYTISNGTPNAPIQSPSYMFGYAYKIT